MAGTYFYHFDGLGSVVALSNTSGAIVERYSGACPSMFLAGDAFGNTTITTTQSYTSPGNPYMFTGRRYDAETELYHYRARTYSPKLGRFLQPDPIGYADSMNLYQYCWNNAVNYTDPTGLKITFLGDPGFFDMRAYNKAIEKLSESMLFRNTYDYLNSEETPLVYIHIFTGKEFESNYDSGDKAISWSRKEKMDTMRGKQPSFMALAHEMEHARIDMIGGIDAPRVDINGRNIKLKEENYIVQWFETPIAKELGLPYRNDYLEGVNLDKCPK